VHPDSPLFASFWIQVAVSVACGFIVGLERQLRGKPAGVRTCILVCLGTATFMRLGIVMESQRADPTRVMGQIITGIGFLGGGLILSKDGLIMGVTSASVIWVLAAVGCLVGVDRHADALALSLVMVFVLLGVETLESGFKAFRRGVHSRTSSQENPPSESE
jgi:putative Mg2+ transporter-C (MgtC) family protein